MMVVFEVETKRPLEVAVLVLYPSSEVKLDASS